MTRYYGAIEIDGRWTPVVINHDTSARTYREAAERIAETTRDLSLEEHEVAATILLDVGSVDLTSRDDFLALMAYDPVLRTMFEFAASGGADTADRIERGELAADAPLLGEMASEPVCRGCGCTDSDCSLCVARAGRPCTWVQVDLCSVCDELGPPPPPLEFHELTLRSDGKHLPGTEVSFTPRASVGGDPVLAYAQTVTVPLGADGTFTVELPATDDELERQCDQAGSKDNDPPNQIAEAIAGASDKGARLQALRDFKPLLELAVDQLVHNAQRQRGAKLHADTVNQLVSQSYGQAFHMLAALGVSAEEMEQADLFPEDVEPPTDA